MPYDFTGKKVLITGAGQGIGRGLAESMAKAGAKVFALSRTKLHLDTLVAEFPSITPIVLDLVDLSRFRTAVEPHLPFDMLVNNAGTNDPQGFLEISEEVFDRLYHINTKVPLFVTQTVAKAMVEHNIKGSIVNVSSLASLLSWPQYTVYSSAKAALNQITKSAATELGPKEIRVNSVSPGVTWTPLGRRLWSDQAKVDSMMKRVPLGSFSEVEDITNTIMFLLSDESRMITGVSLPITGGVENC